jgi:hypothetical protein
MKWALVNTVEVPLTIGVVSGEGMNQKYTLEEIKAKIGTICNLIVYDGKATYVPELGFELQQLSDNAVIGQPAENYPV